MAQWLAQATHNRLVAGSNPAGPTFWASFLRYTLNKSTIYFFPKEFGEDELTALEKELILQARQLSRDDLRKLIAQAKALAGFKK